MNKKQKKTKSTRSEFQRLEPSQWKFERLDELLDAMEGCSILVLGDVGLDRYTLGDVDRISPEAPVPIVRVTREMIKLGLTANVADNLRTLGGVPLLLGVIGRDGAGAEFRDLLKTRRIDSTHLVTDPKRRTIVKERIVSERQQLLRVDYEDLGATPKSIEATLATRVKRLTKKVEAVIIEDYAKGLLTPRFTASVFRAVHEAGKWTAVDPNPRSPLSLYRGARLLTPNTREAEALSGVRIVDLKSLRRAGEQILQATGAEFVVITRGRDGMAIFEAGNAVVRLIPTYAREVYDVSGAGDTVIAVLTLALSSGAQIDEACVLANLAAAVEVGKRGTATVSVDEIRAAFDWVRPPSKPA